MKKMKQQGDVILTRIDRVPIGDTQVIKDKRGFVLAEGEATGHYHGIAPDTDAELVRIGERLLLTLNEPAELKHQEHKPITLEPGIWEVGIVREWDYLAEMERKVVD